MSFAVLFLGLVLVLAARDIATSVFAHLDEEKQFAIGIYIFVLGVVLSVGTLAVSFPLTL